MHGYWYNILMPSSYTYILRDDKLAAHVYFHLVLASKFSLPLTTHGGKDNYSSYELDGNVIDIIWDTLDQVKLID